MVFDYVFYLCLCSVEEKGDRKFKFRWKKEGLI